MSGMSPADAERGRRPVRLGSNPHGSAKRSNPLGSAGPASSESDIRPKGVGR